MKRSRSIVSFLFVGASLLTASMFAQTQPGNASAPAAASRSPNPKASAPALVTETHGQSAAGMAATNPGAPAAQPGASAPAGATSMSTAVVADPGAERFAAVDSNHDGFVTLAEFTTSYNARTVAATNETGAQSGTADATVVFKQLDTDNDTFLSQTELANAPAPQPKK